MEDKSELVSVRSGNPPTESRDPAAERAESHKNGSQKGKHARLSDPLLLNHCFACRF